MKMELLSWIFDHNRRIMKRGFRLLTIGWSDGNSFLPVDFILLAYAKKEKQLQEVNHETATAEKWFRYQLRWQ